MAGPGETARKTHREEQLRAHDSGQGEDVAQARDWAGLAKNFPIGEPGRDSEVVKMVNIDGAVVVLESRVGRAVYDAVATLAASRDPSVVLEQLHYAADAGDVGPAARARLEAMNRVREALRRVQDARAPRADQQTLDYLRQHADLSDPSVLDDWTPERARAAQEEAAAAARLQLEADTVSRDEAAAMLDLHPSTVSRNIAQRKLVAVTRDGRVLLPRWQFVGSEPIPGLRDIAPVLDELGMDPVSVATIMLRPQEAMNGLAPVDYLRSGGEPSEVVAFLDGLART